jgi:hypothetical protein
MAPLVARADRISDLSGDRFRAPHGSRLRPGAHSLTVVTTDLAGALAIAWVLSAVPPGMTSPAGR